MEEATEKQIDFAKKLGIETPEKFDKQVLSALIDAKVKDQPKKEKAGAPAVKSEVKGYHLTPEQVRYNALDIVLRRYPNLESPALMREAETIEKWMLR